MLEEVYLTIVRLSIREAPSSDLPAHSKNFLPAHSKNFLPAFSKNFLPAHSKNFLPAFSKNYLPAHSKNPPSAANAKFGHATVTKRVQKMQNPENCRNRTRYCYKTCPILIPRGKQITGPPRRFIFRERKKAKTPCVTLLHSNNRKGFTATTQNRRARASKSKNDTRPRKN